MSSYTCHRYVQHSPLYWLHASMNSTRTNHHQKRKAKTFLGRQRIIHYTFEAWTFSWLRKGITKAPSLNELRMSLRNKRHLETSFWKTCSACRSCILPCSWIFSVHDSLPFLLCKPFISLARCDPSSSRRLYRICHPLRPIIALRTSL